ncbi:MAG: hypothetical protein WC488_02655 [Candidatus Micrarchaeia archaeon]
MDGDSQIAFKAEKKRGHEPSAFSARIIPRKVETHPSLAEIAGNGVCSEISKYLFSQYNGTSPLAASVHAGIKLKTDQRAPEMVAEKLAKQLSRNLEYLAPQEKRA